MMNQMALDTMKVTSDLLTEQFATKRYVGMASTRLMLIKISEKLDKKCFGNGDGGKDYYLTDISCDVQNMAISFWYRINDIVLIELEHNVLDGNTNVIDKVSINVDLLAGENDNIRTITGSMKNVSLDNLRRVFLSMDDLVLPFSDIESKFSYASGYLHGLASKVNNSQVEIAY